MPVTKWWSRARELPGTPRTRGLGVTVEDWNQCAGEVAASGGRLLAMWASAADSPDSTGTFEIEDIHQGASGAQPGSDATSARAYRAGSRLLRSAAIATNLRETSLEN